MNPDVRRAIGHVREAAQETGVTPVLVGALVTELASERDASLPVPRRTQDADFAVRVDDWASYRRLRESLMRRGAAQDPRIEHRLSLGVAVVDLLPFGPGVTTSEGLIRWPVSKFEMNVAGFEEACAAAMDISIDKDMAVRCVTVPGLVLLKIVAYGDRLARQDEKYRSDAEDLAYWMNNYASGEEASRRYDLSTTGLAGIPYGSAGAAVLGQDVRRILTKGIRTVVDDFVASASDPHGAFANAVVRPSHDDEADDRKRGRIVSLLNAFRAGLST